MKKYLVATAQSQIQVFCYQLSRLILACVDKRLEALLEDIEKEVRALEALAYNLIHSKLEFEQLLHHRIVAGRVHHQRFARFL